MTDQPILFSAPMVCALLAGHKTQTRRVLTHLRGMGGISELSPVLVNDQWEFRRQDLCWNDVTHDELMALLKFQIGDRLWVKEQWFTAQAYDDLAPSQMGGEEGLFFPADKTSLRWDQTSWLGRQRASIHMPRWASRLTLTVTDVCVERLQDISKADARAEGVDWEQRSELTPQELYAELWDTINGAGAWDANPWVVALTFDVATVNIDQETQP